MESWVQTKCADVIDRCRVTAVDGTTLFTPDGVGHYGALWTRDFAYLVEHGHEFLRSEDVRAAIQVLLAGQRADGAIPDRVNRNLVPLYHPGAVDNPLGVLPALDNGMFMVSLVYHYHYHFGDGDFVRSLLPGLRRGLEFIPRNRGLVFNDAQRPSCTYGFQDTVGKGGHDLFCSLLYIIACRQMGTLDPAAAEQWRARAAQTEAGLVLLWDEEGGFYRAASEVCRQFDVWGNAFAVAHGLGSAQSRQRAAYTLAQQYDAIVYRGQVRHLVAPEHWERTFLPVAADTYQNGGYWGTAAGWLIEALQEVDPALARRTFADLLDVYQSEGVVEWMAPDGGKGPDLYVATMVNIWALVKNVENSI
ncbi:MAG: hypothetical protein GKR89_06980 [Candidatus Latescibacteria bacterium]|nr:hypothetical protein [Candidatus Latescibacterota bacterium]